MQIFPFQMSCMSSYQLLPCPVSGFKLSKVYFLPCLDTVFSARYSVWAGRTPLLTINVWGRLGLRTIGASIKAWDGLTRLSTMALYFFSTLRLENCLFMY